MKPRWPNMGQDIRSYSEEDEISKSSKNLRKINDFARFGAPQDAQTEAKMGPSWPKIGPRWAKMGGRWLKIRKMSSKMPGK